MSNTRTSASLRLYEPLERSERWGGRDITRPRYTERVPAMRMRARYGESGPDPRWPIVHLEGFRVVDGHPAVAVADVLLPEYRQRLLDVVFCLDRDLWVSLPPGFEAADSTTELGYQAAIVLAFLAELGLAE